jgi:hypothetical protein
MLQTHRAGLAVLALVASIVAGRPLAASGDAEIWASAQSASDTENVRGNGGVHTFEFTASDSHRRLDLLPAGAYADAVKTRPRIGGSVIGSTKTSKSGAVADYSERSLAAQEHGNKHECVPAWVETTDYFVDVTSTLPNFGGVPAYIEVRRIRPIYLSTCADGLRFSCVAVGGVDCPVRLEWTTHDNPTSHSRVADERNLSGLLDRKVPYTR